MMPYTTAKNHLLPGSIGLSSEWSTIEFVYANKYDREKLVKSRRQERLKALMADESILLKNEGKTGVSKEETQENK